jgi:gliding motility-associated-like protein
LYWLEASNSCGSSTDSIVVNFFNPPALGNDTSACIGSIISLNIGPADSYLWSTGETNPIINVSTSGVYWVETIFDECIARDSIEITFLSIPFTDLGEDSSYCDKNFITLTASPADAYLWSDGSSLASINVSSSGVFWVEASNGNCAFRDSVKLAFNTTPILELGNDTTICQGEFITLTSAMGTSYLWSNGASSSSISVSTAGLYWLELNNESCFIRDSLTLSIDPCDIIVEFPNVFTPNGDGVNDIFLPIELEGIENGKLTIVNRWGLQVFFTENLLHGWDGTANGKSCNDGTYFWIFEYSNVKGETKNITGFVALTGN